MDKYVEWITRETIHFVHNQPRVYQQEYDSLYILHAPVSFHNLLFNNVEVRRRRLVIRQQCKLIIALPNVRLFLRLLQQYRSKLIVERRKLDPCTHIIIIIISGWTRQIVDSLCHHSWVIINRILICVEPWTQIICLYSLIAQTYTRWRRWWCERGNKIIG